MSEEHEANPVSAIQREQKAIRARLDQLDLKVEKLIALDSATTATAITPSSTTEAGQTTQLTDAEPPAGHPEPPPALPAERIGRSPAPAQTSHTPAPQRSTAADLEMKVGMVWFVRIGVVMLLSALVFGSKLAYTAFIADLPPIGKASLCYLFSTALILTGTVLERRHLLKNYAGVLTAGGLAAVYYTTYAIHHVERLRVVENPLVAGILLFLCGLGILAFALYKNSRNLAIAAVALAYYAGSISPLGDFAMFSNLLLTALGVTFLIRRRWAAIGFVCLGATYATFLFWQFLYPQFLHSHSSLGLAPTLTYLTGYWVLFTAGAFVTPARGLSEKRRLAFASANTAAYFVLGTATISAFRTAATTFEFWHFTLALGIAQTGLSLLPALFAQARDRITPLISDCLLASGLSFLTIAAFAKLDGYQLSLTLAAEGALLLFANTRRTPLSGHPPVLLYASMIAAALSATITTHHYLTNQNPLPFAPTAATFVIALAQAHFIRRTNGNPNQRFTFPSTVFIAVALTIGATGLRPHLGSDLQPLALLLAATTMTFASSWRPLRLPELAPLSAVYSYPAAIIFVATQLSNGQPCTTTVSLACLASAMALLLWWHFSPSNGLRRLRPTSVAALAALSFCAMLATSIHLRLDHNAGWQLAGGTTAIALVTFALSIRAWPLALIGSLFHLFAATSFFKFGQPETSSPLASIAPSVLLTLGATLLLLATSKRFFANYTLRDLDGDALVDTRAAARYTTSGAVGLATLTFLFWAIRFFPDYATVVITLGGLVAFAAGLACKVRTARLAAFAILAFALGRILIVDVWGFATFVRFITFSVIGAALVALGFVYNRYQETLRKYL